MPTPRRIRGPRAPHRQPTHGARALARHLAAGTLDGRTWIAKALRDIRLDLAADAGGLEHLTARERVLLDRCAAAVLICSSIEAHVFNGAKPINDAGELLPILRKGYVTHVQSLSRMLQALGLRPARADAALSTCSRCGTRCRDLHEYMTHDCQPMSDAATEPESDAATEPVEPETPTPADAPASDDGAQPSDEPLPIAAIEGEP